MNKNRTKFEWHSGQIRSYSITSDWLLGFIEGEGSYTVFPLKKVIFASPSPMQ